MKFTVGIALSPLEQLAELAKTAEECGFTSIGLPDSLFYMKSQAADYPYTPDGSRFWGPETPWVDPLIAAATMAAVTTKLRFYTNVLRLAQSAPAGPPGRLDRQSVGQPLRLRHRNRLGT